MAYQAKTTRTNESVAAFLNSIEDVDRRRDAKTVNKLMKEITGEKPAMWGKSIVGFGSYDYTYSSGHSGTWMQIGYSPRKTALTLYLMQGFADQKALLDSLGPHRIGKACLYIKRLEDVHLPTLKRLIRASWKAMQKPNVC